MSHLLKFSALQAVDLKLFEKNRAGIRAKYAKNQAQNCAFATSALAHDYQTLLRLHDQVRHLRALVFVRTACARRAVQPFATECSRRKEVGVNDIINRVETDHGCDSGDHAGSRVGADPGGAALHSQSPVAGDRSDEQAKQEALQYPGDDVANEQ